LNCIVGEVVRSERKEKRPHTIYSKGAVYQLVTFRARPVKSKQTAAAVCYRLKGKIKNTKNFVLVFISGRALENSSIFLRLITLVKDAPATVALMLPNMVINFILIGFYIKFATLDVKIIFLFGRHGRL
jgi:hypothetical protein